MRAKRATILEKSKLNAKKKIIFDTSEANTDFRIKIEFYVPKNKISVRERSELQNTNWNQDWKFDFLKYEAKPRFYKNA